MGLFDWLKGKGSQQSGLEAIAPAAPLDKRGFENDDDFEGFYRQGLAELEAGNYEQALMFFDRAIAINGNQAEVWTKRAVALQNLNRTGEAIEANQRAITLIKGNQLLATNNFLNNSTQSKVESSPSIPEPIINLGDAEKWFAQGNSLYLKGRYQEAIASYDSALKIKPDNHDAWYNRGSALGNLGRLEEAISSYDNALKIKPDKHEALKDRGFVLIGLRRLEEAISSYDNALKIKPDDHEAWYNRGLLLKNLGRVEEAISSYDNALKFKPDFHEAWHNRGNVLGNLGRVEEAITSYDNALKIKPDFHEAWHNRGNALGNLGRKEEEIASYDNALKIKPDFHEAWHNRGNALWNLGRVEEAIASYDNALKFKPDYLEAWHNRGNALGNLGRVEEAITSFDNALKIKPDFYQAWHNRGNELGNLGRYKEAIISYKNVLKFKPDAHIAWGAKGVLLCDFLHHYEEAIIAFENSLKIKSDDHQIWHNRGVALRNLGRNEEAIASCDNALKFKPDYHEAWGNRGLALINLGRLEEAITSCDNALKIKPDSLEAWGNRGLALFNLGRNEEAITSYDKALTLTRGKDWQAWINRSSAVAQLVKKRTFVIHSLPLAMRHPDLEEPGYPGRLACLREGLKYVERTTDPEGWGQLHRFTGRAHYDYARGQKNPAYFWRKAVPCYETALETLTEDPFPAAHLETLQDLIRVLTALQDTETAQTLLRKGTDLLERLLSQKTGAAKDQFERKFRPAFNELTVVLAVQTGNWPTALEIAEQDKNALLRQGLLSNQPAQSPDYGQMQTFL